MWDVEMELKIAELELDLKWNNWIDTNLGMGLNLNIDIE